MLPSRYRLLAAEAAKVDDIRKRQQPRHARKLLGLEIGGEGVQDSELEARFALAKAIVATGGDRARAHALAEQARDGWRALGDAKAGELTVVDAWLASRERER